jgi:hypothetical protein
VKRGWAGDRNIVDEVLTLLKDRALVWNEETYEALLQLEGKHSDGSPAAVAALWDQLLAAEGKLEPGAPPLQGYKSHAARVSSLCRSPSANPTPPSMRVPIILAMKLKRKPFPPIIAGSPCGIRCLADIR